MKDFDERREEIFARAQQMEFRRRGRIRLFISVGLVAAVLLIGCISAIFAQRSDRKTKNTETTPSTPSKENTESIPTPSPANYGAPEDNESDAIKGESRVGSTFKSVYIGITGERSTVIYRENEKVFDKIYARIKACFAGKATVVDAQFPSGVTNEDIAYFEFLDTFGTFGERSAETYALWGDLLQDRQTGAVVKISDDDLQYFESAVSGALPGAERSKLQ